MRLSTGSLICYIPVTSHYLSEVIFLPSQNPNRSNLIYHENKCNLINGYHDNVLVMHFKTGADGKEDE